MSQEPNQASNRGGAAANAVVGGVSAKILQGSASAGINLAGLQVCFIAGTLGQGGAERQLFFILQALKQAGALPRVLSLDQGGFWEKQIRELGVPVTWVGQSRTKLGRLLKILPELQRARPRVIQSQHFYTNAYAAVPALLSRARSIGALRSNGAMDVKDCGVVAGWLNLHSPRVIAANSETALRFALQEGVNAAGLFLLPSVVPGCEIRPRYSHSRGPIRLLAVGRLIRAKRFDCFLTVLARLREHLQEEVRGIVVGAGPLQKDLQAQAAALGLTPPALEFCGAAADVTPYYQEADIFVLTSDYEGTPNVLLEAMAAGMPVVATRVGGVPQILQFGENGFSVDPGDLGELQSALTRLVQDPSLRYSLGKRARAYVEANHSPKHLPQNLGRLYQLALGANFRSSAPACSGVHQPGEKITGSSQGS